MSATKSNLPAYKLIVNGDMSADIVSSATNIKIQDNIGFQLVWTGTPVGSFSAQMSFDHEEQNGVVVTPGNWIDIIQSTVITASGSADKGIMNLTQLTAPWIRVKYTATSGTGVLNAWVGAKQI